MFLTMLEKLDLPRASDLPRVFHYHLLAAYLAIALPMMTVFPPWVSGLALVVLALKLLAMHFRFVVPKWVAVIILFGFGGLIFSKAYLLGREYTALALLLVFAALKLLEAREQRDAFLLMLINFLLIMGSLMGQESPLVFAYLIACFAYNIYIQLRIAQPPELGLSLKYNLLAIGKISLASLPFVIVLFFFPALRALVESACATAIAHGLVG